MAAKITEAEAARSTAIPESGSRVAASELVSAGNGRTYAFPSPAKGNLVNIAYQMAETGKARIRVYNDNGDLAASVEEAKAPGPQRSQISIKDFAPGVYIYKTVLSYNSGREEALDVQKFAVSK